MSEETALNNTQASDLIKNYRNEEKAMKERVLQCEERRHMCESINFLRYVPFREPDQEELVDSIVTYDADIKDEVERIRGILRK